MHCRMCLTLLQKQKENCSTEWEDHSLKETLRYDIWTGWILVPGTIPKVGATVVLLETGKVMALVYLNQLKSLKQKKPTKPQMEKAYEPFTTTERCQFWPVHHPVTVLKKVDCLLYKPTPNELKHPSNACSRSQCRIFVGNAVLSDHTNASFLNQKLSFEARSLSNSRVSSER